MNDQLKPVTPKSVFQSKTIWFNLTLILAWLLGLVVDSAESGTLPDFLQQWSIPIAFFGNVLLRLVTDQPVQFDLFNKKNAGE